MFWWCRVCKAPGIQPVTGWPEVQGVSNPWMSKKIKNHQICQRIEVPLSVVTDREDGSKHFEEEEGVIKKTRPASGFRWQWTTGTNISNFVTKLLLSCI